MRTRPKILVTGFGPFPGMADNPSEYLVRSIEQGRLRMPHGIALMTAVLPTSWLEVAERIPAIHASFRPDIALHFGVAGEARGYRIERLARNRNACQPDVDGALPPRPYIHRGGPARRASALPVSRIMLQLRALGLQAELSDDAGGYLCNTLFYLSLRSGEQTACSGNALFIHVPNLSAFAHEKALFRGAEAIIRTCGDHIRSGARTGCMAIHR